MQHQIPFRMYTSEVLALAKWQSVGTLLARRKQGKFPHPIDRGREQIYDGHAVYAALGKIADVAPKEDPILKALESM